MQGWGSKAGSAGWLWHGETCRVANVVWEFSTLKILESCTYSPECRGNRIGQPANGCMLPVILCLGWNEILQVMKFLESINDVLVVFPIRMHSPQGYVWSIFSHHFVTGGGERMRMPTSYAIWNLAAHKAPVLEHLPATIDWSCNLGRWSNDTLCKFSMSLCNYAYSILYILHCCIKPQICIAVGASVGASCFLRLLVRRL